MTPNPCQATAVDQGTESTQLVERESFKDQLRLLCRPAAILSVLVLFHFAMSMTVWIGNGILQYDCGYDFEAWFEYLVPATLLVCAFLLAGFVCLVRAMTKRRHALTTVLCICLVAAGWFVYDVANRRAQMEVTFATKDYWEGGGRRYTYYTWWWFNDGQVRLLVKRLEA